MQRGKQDNPNKPCPAERAAVVEQKLHKAAFQLTIAFDVIFEAYRISHDKQKTEDILQMLVAIVATALLMDNNFIVQQKSLLQYLDSRKRKRVTERIPMFRDSTE